MLDVPLMYLDPDLDGPRYARPGDAGADLMARESLVLAPAGGRAVVGTGVAVAIPFGFAGLLLPRSGLARRHGVTVLNAPGLIDAGYRGEVQVLLVNTDPTEPHQIERGDRVAQLVIVAHEAVAFTAVSELEDSERGESGWGHSGR